MDPTTHLAANLRSRSKRNAVFISYRRSESSGYVGRIRKELAKKFKLFRDLEDIGPGTDFRTAIRDALSASSVLLVVIGPDWLRAKDADGTLRLANPQDYVRLEILTAMEQKLRIIPVLVGGARMPSSAELPDGLQDLGNFQAFELSETRWDFDLAKLAAVIRPLVDPRFRLRWIGHALVAAAVLVAGVIAANHYIETFRIDQALKTARDGKVDEGLEIVRSLENQKSPDSTNPKVYLAEAEIYQMKGDAFHQNAAAVQAAKLAKGNYVVGRAKGLACDAKGKLGLPEALSECQQAKDYSARAGDPIGQVRAINTRANILKATHKPEEALQAYQEALDFGQRNNLLIDQYGALNNIGLILADQGQSEAAKGKFALAARGFKDSGERGEASNALNNMGTVSLDQRHIDDARRYFEESRDLAIAGADKAREAQARLNLGLVLEQTGSLEGAETELKAALQIYEGLGGESSVGFVNNALGDTYLQLANYDHARQSYANAERIRESKEPGAHALSVASLVNLDFLQGQSTPKDLLDRITAAVQEAADAGDSYSESFSRIVRARLLLQLGRTSESEKDAETALSLAKRDKQPDNEVSARIVLAEILARKGNPKQALAEFDSLAASTYHDQNIGQNLEVRLASVKIMKQAGQGSAATVLLAALQKECQDKGYKLLATRAQTIAGR